MKKLKIILPLLAVVMLAGCAGNDAAVQKEEVKQDTGYLQGMLDKNKQAQEDIKNATDAENQRLQETLNNDNNKTMDYTKQYSQAILKTNLGDITIKLSADKPLTVNNFLKLASEKFYDGVKFHRVIKSFMIQGGDPNSKTDNVNSWGMGGPGYQFADELTGKEKYTQGTVAMANAGPNTNGSQFFIVTAAPGYPLPPSYTVFGQVTAGMDVALKIENVKTTTNDRPVEDVMIQGVELMK